MSPGRQALLKGCIPLPAPWIGKCLAFQRITWSQHCPCRSALVPGFVCCAKCSDKDGRSSALSSCLHEGRCPQCWQLLVQGLSWPLLDLGWRPSIHRHSLLPSGAVCSYPLSRFPWEQTLRELDCGPPVQVWNIVVGIQQALAHSSCLQAIGYFLPKALGTPETQKLLVWHCYCWCHCRGIETGLVEAL